MNKRPAGERLFTFVVVADTHMNQAEDRSSSPYPCNVLANARTRHVVAELNRIAPDFAVHLGDIVNPVPELPTYVDAAGHFKELVAGLRVPLHLVPGNHDIGDKPVSWSPAGTVNDEHLRLYESHFGAHYFSFDHRECHIVVVNSPVLNSGLEAEHAQRRWLESDLEANAARRTFIMIHYPPYVSDPEERSNYDNVDEPARGWLLDLVTRYRPEAMFCGHVHNYWYDVFADTEIYILPSTAFVRHDYSEFFRVAPAEEHGRDDRAKLGYLVVDVHERGHVAHTVRTYGRTLAPGAAPATPPPTLVPPHTKLSTLTWLGVDMRHPWAEEIEITPSGALDEFERKRARNDYPVLALQETGLRRMRVPQQDLLDARVRRRMVLMHALGVRFHVCCYGEPTRALWEALASHPDLVETLEIVIEWERADDYVAALRDAAAGAAVSITLSRVNRKDAARYDGKRFNHLISHGFTLAEADELAALQERSDRLFGGFLFKVARDQSPAEAVEEAQSVAARLDARASLYVKSSTASPAETFDDDRINALRIAESIVAGAAAPAVDVILDTFADADRGYFARTGLVDRRYNPRLGSRIVAGLVSLLGDASWRRAGAGVVTAEMRGLAVRSQAGRLMLVLPGEGGCRPGDAAPAFRDALGAAPAQWIDLATHRIADLDDAAAAPIEAPFVLRCDGGA